MLSKRPDLPFWLNIAATALLMFVAPPRNVRERRWGSKGSVGKEGAAVRRAAELRGTTTCQSAIYAREGIDLDVSCGSVARRSRSAAVSRDLPIPGSPDSNTTSPSPVFAFDHRLSSKSSSSSCR